MRDDSERKPGDFTDRPLPSGRHRFSREEIAEHQRMRLLGAMAESVASRGYAATSVAQVIALAGVSRSTFYANFDNRRDCLLAAHQAIFRRFLAWISEACLGEMAWEERAAAAIGAAVKFATVYPEETRLLALDVITADAEAARHGLAAADRLALMLRSGRDHRRAATELPEVTEKALVGAISGIVNWRLIRGESLAGLESQLVHLVLTPYIGAAAAAQMAARFAEAG